MTFFPNNVFMKNTFYILSLRPKTLGVRNKEQTENVLKTWSCKNKKPTLSQICQAQRLVWKPLLSNTVKVTAWNESSLKHFNSKKDFWASIFPRNVMLVLKLFSIRNVTSMLRLKEKLRSPERCQTFKNASRTWKRSTFGVWSLAHWAQLYHLLHISEDPAQKSNSSSIF